jgi:starch phosphorylase
VARYLVQGCDVWLNTPRRGMEASGTSGMKAAMNGVLNCSILDGWWDEAAAPEIGWSIGRGETYANLDVQDQMESQALYELLEKQIVPLFYERDEFGIPRGWVGRMKKCISVLAPAFNTNRMVQEYTENLYLPAFHRAKRLREDGLKPSVELAHKKDRLRANWGRMRIESVDADTGRVRGVREHLPLSVTMHLADLKPEEVRVQVYVGVVDNDGRIPEGTPHDLAHEADLGGGRHRFTGEIEARSSGRYGFAVRVIPGGEMFEGVQEPGLMVWEKVPVAAPAAPPQPVVAEKVA